MSYQRPIVFGVAGGTASGKTTVANTILQAVGAAHVAHLPHDAYYRDMPHLPLQERARQNYDHPNSLETNLLIEQIEQLQRGEPVEVPIYDFTMHQRTYDYRSVTPAPIIMVEGILIFTKRKLRDMMDIKIFVDTDADIRFIRRMTRDLKERGRSLDSIIEQYLATVRPMHLKFVEPSKRYADVIIPEGGMNTVAIDMVVARLQVMLRERLDAGGGVGGGAGGSAGGNAGDAGAA